MASGSRLSTKTVALAAICQRHCTMVSRKASDTLMPDGSSDGGAFCARCRPAASSTRDLIGTIAGRCPVRPSIAPASANDGVCSSSSYWFFIAGRTNVPARPSRSMSCGPAMIHVFSCPGKAAAGVQPDSRARPAILNRACPQAASAGTAVDLQSASASRSRSRASPNFFAFQVRN